jgi:hypothetical protein
MRKLGLYIAATFARAGAIVGRAADREAAPMVLAEALGTEPLRSILRDLRPGAVVASWASEPQLNASEQAYVTTILALYDSLSPRARARFLMEITQHGDLAWAGWVFKRVHR